MPLQWTNLDRVAGRGVRRALTEPTDEEAAPSYTSRALSLLADAPMLALEGLDYVDSATRAGLASLKDLLLGTSTPRSGRETFLGTAPSGRELLGLGTGSKGEFEWQDVPGFLTELAASPLNLVGFGGVTKAGEAARSIAGLKAIAKAAEARGAGEMAAEALGALAKRGAAGATAEWTPKLAEQAARGLRRGLTIDLLPSVTGIRIPVSATGGRASGAVMQGLDALRGLGGRLVEPIAQRAGSARLRPASFTPAVRSELTKVLGSDPEALWNALYEQSRGVTGQAGFDVGQLAGRTGANLARFAKERPAEATSALEQVSAAVGQRAADMAAYYDQRIAAAEAAGNAGRVKGLQIQRARDLRALQGAVRETPQGATNALALQALELGGRVPKIDAEVARLTEAHARATVKRQRAITSSWMLGDENAARRLEGLQAAAETKLASTLERRRILKAGGEDVLRLTPAPVLTEVRRMEAALGEAFAQDQAAGMRYKALRDALLGYAPRRSMSRDAAQWANTLPETDPLRRYIKQFQTTGRHMLERVPELDGLSIPAINDLARSRGFAGDLLNENVTEIVSRRLLEGARARSGAGMAVGALTLFALPEKLAGDGAVPIAKLIDQLRLGRVGDVALSDDALRASAKGLKDAGATGKVKTLDAIQDVLKGTAFEDAYVPKAVADGLTKVHTLLHDPSELGKVGRFLERANAAYRLGVTQMFPAFHVRNEVSDMMMMYLAGMRLGDVKYLGRAASLQMRVRNLLRSETGGALRAGARIADDADVQLLQRAFRDGSLGETGAGEAGRLYFASGSGAQAAAGGLRELAAAPIKAAKGAYDWAAGHAVRLGTARENTNKLALYLWGLDQGMTGPEAGALAKKYLFDYGDLTWAEKKPLGLRSLSYFYTYARKAIPLLLDEIARDPRRARALTYGLGAAGSRAEGRDLLPAWLRERVPFGAGTDAEGNQRFYSLGLPWEQLTQFGSEGKGITRVLQKLAAQTAPLPRQLGELLTNYDLRTGRNRLRADVATQNAIDVLPVGLQRELRPLQTLVALSPVARFTSTAGTVGQAVTGNRPIAHTLASLIGGVGTVRVDPKVAGIRSTLDKIEQALDNLGRMGLDDSDRARELRSLRGRKRRELKKVAA